ncbi:RdRP-domain-containing protein [Serendipita vermifera]|nr:RdRP-domain-containing protein [Serendipita vermifera]
MEVFMTNIPYGTTNWQLTRRLEPILHGPKFEDLFGGARFNFIVRIITPKKRNSSKNGLCGKLLLPTAAIGNRLLLIAATSPVYLHKRMISMARGRHGVGPDDLILLKEPYQDPATLEAEEQRRSEITGKQLISAVEFGWPCHDDIVSIEWTSLPCEKWTLEFNPDTHRWVLSSNTGLRVLVSLSSIHSAALNTISCILWLERCPMFDQSKAISQAALYNSNLDGFPRIRLTTLDPTYERVFAHSRAILIVFTNHHSVEVFQRKAEEIGLSLDNDFPMLDRRELFSSTAMAQFNNWLPFLPFDVAFQLEGLLSRCRFHPKELMELRDELASALDRYPQFSICARLQVLEQRRDENPGASALSLFHDLIAAMERGGQVGSFLQPTPNLFHCHRVVVTPTSFILRGPLPEVTNRVIRKYIDNSSNFIRVEFREEDRLQFRWDDETDEDKFIEERFLKRIITFSVHHILRGFKYKARIPVEKAWTLVGVADEWSYLKEDEIFACICTIDGHKEYLEGPVMISRSPTVHPGDARMVKAIGKPANAPSSLTNLINCVVFSCEGRRPLPSMLAGGDLDGDIYCLVMDESLFPRKWVEPSSHKPAKRVELDRHANARDLANFVVNYIKNDLLGVIASRLILNADISPDCMEDKKCLELAALHSDAVDFPKTGRPVERSQLPQRLAKSVPDWYVKETADYSRADIYQSERHIGHLFRAIKLPAVPEAKKVAKRQQRLLDDIEGLGVVAVQESLLENDCIITKKLRNRVHSLDLDVNFFLEDNVSDSIKEILESYERYSAELSYLCKSHSLSTKVPLSEEEIVTGTIVAKCSQPRVRRNQTSTMRRDATGLCETIREEIEGFEETSYEGILQRAWIAWKVALAYGESFGAKSFGLLALDVMFSTFREMTF